VVAVYPILDVLAAIPTLVDDDRLLTNPRRAEPIFPHVQIADEAGDDEHEWF